MNRGSNMARAMREIPPYRSVRHAIREAYASEVLEVVGRVRTVSHRARPKTDGPDGPVVGDPLAGSAIQERASGVQGNGQGAYERIAEGHWCMNLIRDTLDDDLMTAVDAKYTQLGDPLLEVRKYAAVVRLSGMVLRAGVYGPPDYDYTIAAVAEWSGFGALNSEIWAAHLGKTTRTMRNWRYGRGDYGVGIDDRLRVYLSEAHYQLEIAMAERGLVFRADEPICEIRGKDIKKGSAAWSGLLRLPERKYGSKSYRPAA